MLPVGHLDHADWQRESTRHHGAVACFVSKATISPDERLATSSRPSRAKAIPVGLRGRPRPSCASRPARRALDDIARIG